MALPRPQPSPVWRALYRSRLGRWLRVAAAWLGDDSTYGMPATRAMGTIAALSLAGSLLCALFLLALIHAHAPMTDASASEPYFALLFDPLVLPVVIAWTLFSAVIVFPFGVWLLRGRKIVPTFLVVLAATLLAVVTVIPVAKAIGLKRGWWASGYLAVVAALIACRWMPALKLPSREGRA